MKKEMMKHKKRMIWICFVVFTVSLLAFGCVSYHPPQKENTKNEKNSHRISLEVNMNEKVVKTDKEWKKILTDEQFHVARKNGTERAFTGKYHDHHEKGTYRCVCCGNPLFSSEHKFDSGSGWPSYWTPLSSDAIILLVDSSLFMKRTEVLCSRCDAHLGHVFPDGPPPTHKRYCINSATLDFVPDDKMENPAIKE